MERNFLYELLDTRWVQQCRARQLDPNTAQPPTDVWADLRHCISHQLKSGNVVLLSRSLPYWFWGERTACPREILRHQGWPEVEISSVSMPVPGMGNCRLPQHLADQHGSCQKRRRRMPVVPPCPDALVVELGGNARCVPDLCMVYYCLKLSIDSDEWEFPSLSVAQLASVLQACGSDPTVEAEVEVLAPGPEVAEAAEDSLSDA